ncbi:MAG: hypothetical protein QGF59_05350, partial [Pirellulaceae bacterium]|nr:hypothetical protein [Pirellulaceae bacterium]
MRLASPKKDLDFTEVNHDSRRNHDCKMPEGNSPNNNPNGLVALTINTRCNDTDEGCLNPDAHPR